MDAQDHGYVETILGRRRPISDINSSIISMRNAAERMAINSVVQGSAADLIKIAMLERLPPPASARSARAGCCSRSTTSWSSRRPPTPSKPDAAIVREEMTDGDEAEGAAEGRSGVGEELAGSEVSRGRFSRFSQPKPIVSPAASPGLERLYGWCMFRPCSSARAANPH